MDELIARLEAASEGSIELDARIACALNDWPVPNKPNWMMLAQSQGAKPWSTSCDAALTLVPEGWVWKVSNGYSVKCSAELAKPVNTEFGAAIAVRSQIFGQATPALALCIAALKARSHTAPQEK